jgi:ubiquinone/menaquinone biosynthesis C-methylase UbiE
MDIPRIFTVSESEHRIHNPFTPEKYATLGRVLRMKPDTRILDLGSGSGEMLCTWARDHGITGTGIDMSPLFTTQAKLRAEELALPNAFNFFITTRQVTLRMKNVTWRRVLAPHGLQVASPER